MMPARPHAGDRFDSGYLNRKAVNMQTPHPGVGQAVQTPPVGSLQVSPQMPVAEGNILAYTALRQADKDMTRALGVPRNPIVVGVTLEKGPSPIKIQVLEEWLKSYPCREDANYLVDGFKYGFRIPTLGECRAVTVHNLRSVIGMEDIVQWKINKEVKEVRVLGPFSAPPLENLRVSPLGIVPKKAQGELRLIHQLFLAQLMMPSLQSDVL